jgi:DNA-binding IclR family transcriptional regulator
MRDPQAEPSDLIRSVSRALRVLESVGGAANGLTVKQIARRCDLTVATAYHLVRTLTYEGYMIRREDGTYIVGLEIADRFRELCAALAGPPSVDGEMRRIAERTGYSHYLGQFVGGKVAITMVAEGSRSPHLEDLVPGFDDGAHATALGKALLATLNLEQRTRYLKEFGMRTFTPNTLATPAALEADLVQGDRRGMQIEVNQYRRGVACASVLLNADRDPERRIVLACAMPADDLLANGRTVRARLVATARALQETMTAAAPEQSKVAL